MTGRGRSTAMQPILAKKDPKIGGQGRRCKCTALQPVLGIYPSKAAGQGARAQEAL